MLTSCIGDIPLICVLYYESRGTFQKIFREHVSKSLTFVSFSLVVTLEYFVMMQKRSRHWTVRQMNVSSHASIDALNIDCEIIDFDQANYVGHTCF